jgi:hypothetical protein
VPEAKKMTMLRNSLNLVAWLLSQMLGTALPALPDMAKGDFCSQPAWEKAQSAHVDFDNDALPGLGYNRPGQTVERSSVYA